MDATPVRTLIIAGMTLLGGAAQPAAAAHPFYGDEIGRCVTALRPVVSAPGAASVVHTVTGIEVKGLWRVFTIESEVRGQDGHAMRQVVSRCQAERWGKEAHLAAGSRS